MNFVNAFEKIDWVSLCIPSGQSTNAVNDVAFDLLYYCLKTYILRAGTSIQHLFRFPTYNEINEKFESVPLNNIFGDDGYFTTEFLEYFFQYEIALKAFINYMDLRHHLLIHLCLNFIP